MVEVADQEDIVNSFCQLEEFDAETRRRMFDYASLSVARSSINIFDNPTCIHLLPEDYQNDIIEETVFKAIAEKIRIFRDLNRQIQLSLSFQFRVI